MTSDDQSEATDYHYQTFVNCRKSLQKHPIPSQIPTSTLTTASDTYLEDSDNPTPFLKSGGDKALPQYSGRANEDINAFFYKLKIFPRHPSIENCHLHKSTTSDNSTQSKYLCTLLGLCLSSEVLHQFLVNSKFKDKGIEMYHHLQSTKQSVSKSSASRLFQLIFHTKIAKDESFELFARQLRTTYRACNYHLPTLQMKKVISPKGVTLPIQRFLF